MDKSAFYFLFPAERILFWKKPFLGPLGNNSGQTVITGLILLSLLLTVTVVFGSSLALVQGQNQIMTTCRLASLKVQSDVEPLIKKLWGLNPQARLLRTLIVAAKVRLAAAVAAQNWPLAAVTRQQITSIRKQQHILEMTQKGLIRQANLILHTGTYLTYVKMKEAFQEIAAKGNSWARIEFYLQTPRVPKLAVKPADSNLAPPYLPWKNFEEQQATSQFWTESFETFGFIRMRHKTRSQCHATLEENSWVPKIRKDKPYLKWL